MQNTCLDAEAPCWPTWVTPPQWSWDKTRGWAHKMPLAQHKAITIAERKYRSDSVLPSLLFCDSFYRILVMFTVISKLAFFFYLYHVTKNNNIHVMCSCTIPEWPLNEGHTQNKILISLWITCSNTLGNFCLQKKTILEDILATCSFKELVAQCLTVSPICTKDLRFISRT